MPVVDMLDTMISPYMGGNAALSGFRFCKTMKDLVKVLIQMALLSLEYLLKHFGGQG
jgi:hypothetical protein